MLIDDDPDCRQMVRDALEIGQICNPVYEVDSGTAALEFLDRAQADPEMVRPGLIYLDLEMPGLDGLETLRLLRAQPGLADVSIVMLTGVTDDSAKRRALQLGANSFANKPIDAKQFAETVLAATHYWTRIHQRPARGSQNFNTQVR
ncbi:MAG: response regulator [Phycisphaerae bacterium]